LRRRELILLATGAMTAPHALHAQQKAMPRSPTRSSNDSIPYCNNHGQNIAGFICHDANDAPGNPTGRGGSFNLKERFCCRLAAGEKFLIIGSAIGCDRQ
jgi:hypothetical protein